MGSLCDRTVAFPTSDRKGCPKPPFIDFNLFQSGIDFIRHNVTSKVGPSTERVDNMDIGGLYRSGLGYGGRSQYILCTREHKILDRKKRQINRVRQA